MTELIYNVEILNRLVNPFMTTTARPHVAVIGAGIVGLATAWRLSERGDIRVTVFEAESAVALHQSGRNSGVLHSGIYYRPGSLKARFCLEGRRAMERFCADRGLPFRRTGKLIVARRESEIPALETLLRRGSDNGLRDLKMLDRRGLRELEPHIRGVAALWVPATGITDFRRVAGALAAILRERGVEIRLGVRVRRIAPRRNGIELAGNGERWQGRWIVNCAGLYADRLARWAGLRPNLRILPFRGEYRALRPNLTYRITRPVYPVPDLRFPFLGVHFTPTLDGRTLVGPNAVLAFHRTGYARTRVSVRDLWDTLTYPGFWRLARRYPAVGWNEWLRAFSRRRWLKEIRSWLPEARMRDFLPAPAGVRAQAVGPHGELIDDFVLVHGERSTHVLNAPSPAATSSLRIGEALAAAVRERL